MRTQERYFWWGLIVGANSLPGLLIAWGEFDHAGISAGIATWALVYFGLLHTRLAEFCLNRRSFRFALGTAVAIRAIPLTWIVDFFIGAIVTGGSAAHGPGDAESAAFFLRTLRATLVHGLVVGLLFWFLVFVLDVAVFWFVKNAPLEGYCAKCGYDLRASPVRCPECGTPNPNGGTVTAMSNE